MAALYLKKYFSCKALDVDTSKKQVKIAIAQMEDIDKDGDLILPDAMDKTVKERGPNGSKSIWHLLDHSKTSFSALSKFSELGREGKYMAGVSPYKDSFAWREVAWPLYEGGDFTEHSIGYQVVREQKMSNYNELREITLFEGSAVLWGANPYTPTLAVQKSLGISENDDIISQLERLTKAICLGKHEDESHRELIIIEIKRIQQSILLLQQKSTLPEEQSTTLPNLENVKLLNDTIARMNLKIMLAR